MKKRCRIKPFRQGQLDGLCGPYSVINAVHYLVGPLSKVEATNLLRDMLKLLDPENESLWRRNEGMMTPQIERILRDLVLPRYPIARRRVARTRREMNVRGFFARISRFCEETGGVVLSGYDGEDSHWTVFIGATSQTLKLFDSVKVCRIRRSSCTTSRSSNKHRVILYPTCSYYLWVTDQADSE